MKTTTLEILDTLVARYPQLEQCRGQIEKAFLLLKDCFECGGRLFVCGNGGSAADCEHIVGELLKSFKKRRKIDSAVYDKLATYGSDGLYLRDKLEGALPAYSLVSQSSIISAFANDKSWDATFAQQLYGLGNDGDCLIAISTSGNSVNCVYAAMVAKAKGINVVSLTGVGGGKLQPLSDCTITVPATETYAVQELHLPVYHCLCAMLEEELF